MICLPEDLLRTIASFFRHDFSTLRSLSLVSRALLPICRERLFKMVTIHPPYSSRTKIARYRKFLQDAPHAAAYTRTLVIVDAEICEWAPAHSRADTDVRAAPTTASFPMDSYITRNWTLYDPDLPAILKAFKRLKYFMWTHANKEITNWMTMSEAMQAGVKEILELEDIITINLTSIHNFPLGRFQFPPSLRALYFDNVLRGSVEEGWLNAGTKGEKAYLEVLSFRYWMVTRAEVEAIATWLSDTRCPIYLGRLKVLELPACWLGRNNPIWESIIIESVEKLGLWYRTSEMLPWGECIGLEKFPSLRHLGAHFRRVDYSQGGAFAVFVGQCERSVRASNLTHLTLTVTYGQGREISQSGFEPWHRLDEVLSASSKLAHVEARFIPDGGEPILTPVPDIHLPLLEARAGVGVKIVDERYGTMDLDNLH